VRCLHECGEGDTEQDARDEGEHDGDDLEPDIGDESNRRQATMEAMKP
jgi:hypothetical protein